MIDESQIDAFLKSHSRKNPHFNVAPRFTPGSPALVDRDIAVRVAMEEEDSFDYAKEGRYGDRFKETAETKGLNGIVEVRAETRKGWDVLDLLTGERFVRPFPKA